MADTHFTRYNFVVTSTFAPRDVDLAVRMLLADAPLGVRAVSNVVAVEGEYVVTVEFPQSMWCARVARFLAAGLSIVLGVDSLDVRVKGYCGGRIGVS